MLSCSVLDIEGGAQLWAGSTVCSVTFICDGGRAQFLWCTVFELHNYHRTAVLKT